jgi:uncharacterized protein YjdB
MKKIISLLLTLVMTASILTICSTTNAATTTTFNGKKAVKGEYVYVTYSLKAPEKMEDIQAYVKYSSGLKLKSVSYSSEMKKGSFIYNNKLSNTIKFNAVCVSKPMDFTKSKTLVKIKFLITKTGKQKSSLTIECLDDVNDKPYGKTQKNTNYKKIKITTTNKMMVYSVKLNKTTIKLKKNKTYTLKKTITPSSASKSVTWKSSNKKIAKVNSSGKVTALKKGTCYITCKSTDGSNKYKKCKVIVK